MLAEEILQYLRSPEPEGFEALALRTFAFQFGNIPAYRRLCERRGRLPGTVTSWREVPAVPAVAFKTLELAAAPGGIVFRSSGTTGEGRRSVHRNPFPQLYRAAIDASFPKACLPVEPPAPGSAGAADSAFLSTSTVPMLSLIPAPEAVPDSSLSFMVGHILERWAAPGSAYALTTGGFDGRAARRWLREREGGPPVLILSTALSLAQCVEELDAAGESYRLAPGSAVFETGGFKGRRRETSRRELLPKVEERLGVARQRVVREYGMTELSSQFYTRSLAGGSPDVFVPPPWTRVRILDPATLAEAHPGRAGLVAVFDLANLGSAAHLLTEDLGVMEGNGFRLLGRASGAELRGCSLTAEELGRPA